MQLLHAATPLRVRAVSLSLRAVVIGCDMAVAIGLIACRPSDVLSVPPPSGVTPGTVYQNLTGAEGLFANGKAQTFQGLVQVTSGLLEWSGLLGDEFTWTYFAYQASAANVDARVTRGTGGFKESGDAAITLLLAARLTLLSAIPGLEQYEPAGGRAKVGEAFALIGYAELLAAESYCAGVPLDALGSVTGVRYGMPLTSDSLLRVAEADFDSAKTYAAGDATIGALAAVGLGRTLVDRGQFAAAAAAVNGVPTGYVYNTELQPGGATTVTANFFNLYDDETASDFCGLVNVGDRKGTTGLNYVSAHDPRLVLSTSVIKTCDGYYGTSTDSVSYYPVKFGNPSTYVPLATGVEARLIEAEAALQANQLAAWAGDLNAVRAAAPASYLGLPAPMDSLPTDSTTGANASEQVDVMFRERAFWLYGTGTRLGDMRRLIRQYGRDQSVVFPTGSYPNAAIPSLPSPLPVYGTDVNLTLPTAAGGLSTPNPTYKGCITSTKQA